MDRAQKLATALLYHRDSQDGMMKQQVLSGKSPFGRICTISLDSRTHNHRAIAEDLKNLSVKMKRLTTLSEGTPNKELHEKFWAEVGPQNAMDLFLKLMTSFTRSGHQLVSHFMDQGEYNYLVEGCQIEVFLFHAMNRVGFIYEVFPQIEGVDTDQFYGSHMRAMTPITYFTKNQMALGEEMVAHSMFGSIALSERLSELSKIHKVDALDMRGGWTFSKKAEDVVQEEWSSDTSLWMLHEERYTLCFLSNFIIAFAIQHALANKSQILTLIGSPDHVQGKYAAIKRG